jgi:methyl-accepting chemotaxis protein
MIRFISSACDEQQCGSEQVIAAAEDIRHSTNSNLEAIRVMNEALLNLYSQAETLKKEMSAFRV